MSRARESIRGVGSQQERERATNDCRGSTENSGEPVDETAPEARLIRRIANRHYEDEERSKNEEKRNHETGGD